MDLQKELEKVGLNEKEAAVYRTLLEMGTATALQISRQTGIKRPTVYSHLESLEQKGLVSQLATGKTRGLFEAAPLESIIRMLKENQREATNRLQQFEELLPDLKIRTSTNKPRVRVIEGNAIWEKHRELSTNAKEKIVRAMYNLDEIHRVSKDEARKELSDSRVKNKVISRVIYNSSEGPVLQKNDKERLRESIWLPDDKIKISFNFIVFDSTVLVQSTQHGSWGLAIESQDIAESFKGIFDLLWLSFAGKIQNVVRSL